MLVSIVHLATAMSIQDLGTPQPPPAKGQPSTWEPLRSPTFRMLWAVWAISSVCLWANDVAAAVLHREKCVARQGL